MLHEDIHWSLLILTENTENTSITPLFFLLSSSFFSLLPTFVLGGLAHTSMSLTGPLRKFSMWHQTAKGKREKLEDRKRDRLHEGNESASSRDFFLFGITHL